MAMPRLSHPKSRNGCLRCKARKVKCDETRPSCGACSRHQTPCIYEPTAVKTNKSVGRSSSHAGPHGGSSWDRDSGSYGTGGQDRRKLELKLMHQWTYATASSFISVPIWSAYVPQLALEHPYLLNSIFAVAALHLAKTDPIDGRDWHVPAREYFSIAIRSQHEVIDNVTELNCDAVGLTTTAVAFYALVLNSESESGRGSWDTFQLWIKLSMGIKAFIITYKEWVMRSTRLLPLMQAPLIGTGARRNYCAEDGRPLRHILEFGKDFETMTEADEAAYDFATNYVGAMYTAVTGPQKEDPKFTSRRLLSLPMQAHDNFLELILQRRPRALVLMAYAFASMHLNQTNEWFMEGLAEQVVSLFQDNVPAAWREMLDWPVKTVSIKPEASALLPPPAAPGTGT